MTAAVRHGECYELFVFHVSEVAGDHAADSAVGDYENRLVPQGRVIKQSLYERIYSGSNIQKGFAAGVSFKALALFALILFRTSVLSFEFPEVMLVQTWLMEDLAVLLQGSHS